jgi:regulator of protease activity HflC (stomatin/prohibitin superfamily)
MERNIKRHGLINFLALLAVAVAGLAVTRNTHTLAGTVSLIFIGLGALVAAVSWFQMRLEERERIEKLELEELAKGHAGSAMFEAKDSEVFPAQRSREQFDRFFVPGFTVLLFLLQAGGAYVVWRWLSRPTTPTDIKQPGLGLALFALFALVLFLLGKFSSTIARIENHRLLRPGASYLLLGAYLCFLVTLGLIGVQAGFPRTDFFLARGLAIVLGLVAFETLVNLILELYRPRVKGKIERPLYESRLVGLLGQPEGLITTAAQALDYQFGFKVSETWFYRLFVERALAWFFFAQVAVLFLSTCVVFIEAGEQGVLERFGQPVPGRTVLNAGPHLKLPWPIDVVYRFRTEQIQSFEIGTSEEQEDHDGRVVLWTVAHTKPSVTEDNFLVANRGPSTATNITDAAQKRTPPVSLLTGTLPVQFVITNVLEWAYNNEDAPALLHDLASREIVRFLAGVDMNEVMSYGRQEAAQALRARIQDEADQRKLGASIISVSLQDLHPPVKVAPEYEKVVGATHTARAKILAARADQIRTNAMSEAQATNIINIAESDRIRAEVGARARAGLFVNQIPAYEAAPTVYAERAYLQTFMRATANARKYLLLTTNTHDVMQFDLQDKIRADLLDAAPPPPKTK